MIRKDETNTRPSREGPAERRAATETARFGFAALVTAAVTLLFDLVTSLPALNDLLAPAAIAAAVLAVAALVARAYVHWTLRRYSSVPRGSEAEFAPRLTPQLRQLAKTLSATEKALTSGEVAIRRVGARPQRRSIEATSTDVEDPDPQGTVDR